MSRYSSRLRGGARRFLLAAAIVASSPAPALLLGGGLPAAALADDGWKDEFADVCSKTQDAMTLSDAELRALVERCDRLKAIIEGQDEPVRKVYTRRLLACRELYQFVLDSRAPGASR